MFDWQPLVAGLIVAAAAVWLARRVLRIVRSGSRDGEGHLSSCGSCPKNPEAANPTPLVQLGKKESNR